MCVYVCVCVCVCVCVSVCVCVCVCDRYSAFAGVQNSLAKPHVSARVQVGLWVPMHTHKLRGVVSPPASS